jgi:hypothetical protein
LTPSLHFSVLPAAARRFAAVISHLYLRLPAYSASAKVICFIIEKLGDWCPVILQNQEVFFRVSLVMSSTKFWRKPEKNTFPRGIGLFL